MSDDLVKRLREGDHFEKVMSSGEAADRIEELEAKGLANRVAIMRLEAKMAKAVKALANAERQLQEAADYWGEDSNDWARAPFTIAAKQAHTTIAELKGQTHDH